MCYYGSKFSKGIKKDQGHFNLIADLHTLVRDAQFNIFYGKEGKKELIKHLNKLIKNVEKGEYENLEENTKIASEVCLNNA